MTVAAVAVAASRKRARERIVSHLRELTALTPAKPSPIPVRNSTEQRMLNSLLACGAVVAVGHGTYYLDEAALRADDERRRRQSLTAVLVVVGTLLAVLAITYLAHAARV